MQEKLSKSEKRFLLILSVFKYVDRKLLRLYYGNYDNNGRKITRLLKGEYVEETVIKKRYYPPEKVFTLTAKGLKTVKEIFPEYKNIITEERCTSGIANHYMFIKLSAVFIVFSRYFPNLLDQYLKGRIGSHRYSDINEYIEEIKNNNNEFLFFFRELFSLFPDEMKKISGRRGIGILYTQEGVFVLYNHNRKRMITRGEYEEKVKDFASQLCEGDMPKSIHFARGYQCIIDTINDIKCGSPSMDEILLSGIYNNCYFIPLHRHGQEQLELFFIKDSERKIQEKILLPDEIERARNAVYHGETEDKKIIYLGFHCDVWEIIQLVNVLRIALQDRNIIVYCFEHQVGFYKEVFKEYNLEIKKLPVSQVINAIK